MIDLLLALMGLTVLVVFVWVVKKLDDRNQYIMNKKELATQLEEREQWKKRKEKDDRL
jgi:di/tricarboxylate transporter|tara:strand:- start:8 stop:181 length:174 start_codon:yes stop_codon:yes gene_type:complete